MDKTNIKKIYLSSGGTGGHVFPALALGASLKTLGHTVALFTDSRGERFSKDKTDIKTHVMQIKRASGPMGKILYPLTLGISTLNCITRFILQRPDAVVGFGGYPSLPAMVAAQILKIPTIIHEQNALMGKANRYLQKKCNRVALSFPETKGASSHAIFVGNPVRKSVVDVAYIPYTPSSDGLFRILVMGGSQGAKIFSSIIPEAIALMEPEQQACFKLIQQCRAEYLNETTKRYKNLKCQVELHTFITDVEKIYTESDLIITRSGASTVAEVAVLGRPALFIPLSTSVEGDQRYNAQQFVDHNAGWMIPEKDFSAVILKEHLENLKNVTKLREDAAQNAKKLGVANASENLSKIILDLLD